MGMTPENITQTIHVLVSFIYSWFPHHASDILLYTLHTTLSPGLPYSMMVVYKTTHRLAKICNLFLALTLLAFNFVQPTSMWVAFMHEKLD